MLRRSRSALVAVLAVTALGLAAPAVQAQDYPGTTVPAVCTSTVSASGALLPNAQVTITGSCSTLPNGVSASGVLQSTPIALPAVTIAGNAASFPVKLPADWETKAFHTLNITRAADGVLLFSGRFYVDGSGRITAPPKGGSDLPRTGASNTDGLAKAGVVLLAGGAAATLLARKRRAGASAA